MNTDFPAQSPTPEPSDSSQQRVLQPRLRSTRIFRGTIIVLALLLLMSTIAATFVLRTMPRAQASGGPPTPTPTPITPVPGQPLPQGSLYTAAPGGLTRIDLKSSNVLWTIPASYPSAPLVMGKALFFDNEDSTSPVLEAADTKTGASLWSSQTYPNGFLLGAGNMLYDSSCDLSTTGVPCHLYGINASTGAQLWSYDVPSGNAWIALQNGVLYGVSYTVYFALNASTGVPLWQKDLLNYTDQEANMTPVVRGNVLSFASCNETKQSTGYTGCYLYAFNASTGEEFWHMPTTSSLQVPPSIMDGVVYAGAIDGTLYAVNELTGELLWSTNVGSAIGQVLSSAGTVYVETIGADGQSFNVEAFDAATHAPRWGQASASIASLIVSIPLVWHAAASAGPASHPFVLTHGLIYIQSDANTITVLKATDGSGVIQYTVPGNALSGFTVVMQ